MTGRIIHEPRQHHCRPGWTQYVITNSDIPALNGRIGLKPPDTRIQPGDIWECDCGRTWVAYRPYANVLSPSFRREGRITRWRRQWKEAE